MALHFTYPKHYLDTEIVAHARPTYPTLHHCSKSLTKVTGPVFGGISSGQFKQKNCCNHI